MRIFFVHKSRPGKSTRQHWLQSIFPGAAKILFAAKEKELVPVVKHSKGVSYHPAERKMARNQEPSPKP